MTELRVGKKSEIPEGERRILHHDGLEIGVFHWQGTFYAYENLCVHQGGPACEGLIMHQVEPVFAADRTLRGQRFALDQPHFVCPWHGYEYDLKTGECAADRRLRLRSFPVVERAGELFVVTG